MMESRNEIEERIREIEDARLILNNIIEGSTVGRFIFTNREKDALAFIDDVLDGNVKSFEEEI